MRKPLIDPLIASTYIANQRRLGRRKALVWFNLVAFGFILGIITGHLLCGR
jgi:hypothetical protein